ncbi:hypothetical protein A3L09_09175 [Thermococcus profundus]|uniref:Uncharacterized protein n=1 Tax=Thermococcus profundus TaxID=49899 RepID=A0A2Z2MND3_THEPR|nr:hypothetical protein [Thermococcus profundus]ASJ03418.1 hypothetical protein A3L09_09175 [Thermococcus profundus]
MVRAELPTLVLLMVLASLVAMHFAVPGSPETGTFLGICVKSNAGYSILYNGTDTVLVPEGLESGRIYRIMGRIVGEGGLSRVSGGYRVEPVNTTPSWAETVRGFYWVKGDRAYVLSPRWTELSAPLDAPKGSKIRVVGVLYGSKLYPLEYDVIGEPNGELKDGKPAQIEGVVLGHFGADNLAVVWSEGKRIYAYLPYGASIDPGLRVRILGRVRLTSRINIYVDSVEDFEVLGTPDPVPINGSTIGEVGEGKCRVVKITKGGLRLDCTELVLRGISARTGDLLNIKALNAGSYLRCLDCRVEEPRENLPNEICNPVEGKFSRISGDVEWVKVYRNGFGLANVTRGSCWVLLKLPKSLGITVSEGEHVSAYGFFTTYRGKPAFEVSSGDDLCSGNC